MGMSYTCPGDEYVAIDDSFEDLIMRSISFSENVKSSLRSVSFNGRDSKAAIFKAFGSGKLIVEGSLSFNGRKMDPPLHLKTEISIKNEEDNEITKPENSTTLKTSSNIDSNPLKKTPLELPSMEPPSPKHEAAVKLQKVYKSFRTRRRLADCAVLVEQRWWKLLDFALLKRSSVSFFDIEKPESAVSKWSRARTRAAKVGKGLSKDEKAQKLALQHWLEAIDPRHRYGHNLHYYYDCWLRCESIQPFFYWLDVGEGKEVNLEEQCARSKLQQQCIKYLGPKEREAYEVIVEDGKFMYKHSRKLLDTTEGPKDAKWIFVLSTAKTLYVGQKKKGKFQHSSFLAGGATSAAGRLIVGDGVLKAVWPHSGHYRPTEENFQEFMSFLKENSVDLSDVKKNPSEEEEELLSRLGSSSSRMSMSERSASIKAESEVNSYDENTSNVSAAEASSSSLEASSEANLSCSPDQIKIGDEERPVRTFGMHLRQQLHAKFLLNYPEESKEESDETLRIKEPTGNGSHGENESAEDSTTTEEQCVFLKRNLFVDDKEGEEEAALVPPELILRRINSKKGMKSYQLGKQLSFKWTTGAGPRIGCVRDYPSELQFRSLEQVNLSPRGPGPSRLSSPRPATLQNTSVQEMPFSKEQHRLKS